MAGQRLTDKTELTEQLSKADLLMCVDVSDTTGSSAGTSKKIKNSYIIQTDIVTGNMDLDTTPLTLVSAPGLGYFIQPITLTLVFDYTAPASIATGYAYFSYDSSSTTDYIARQRDLFKNQTNDVTYIFGASDTAPATGSYAGSIENKGLYLYGMDMGGGSGFKAYVTYQIVKL